MNGENINIYEGKRILVAPLDWGLGHYTRCIPIIKALVQAGAIIFIAAEKQGAILFEQEFPGIKIILLKGYRVRYNKSRQFFSLNILLQLPKLTRAIRSENKWLKEIISEFKIDLVISDNRYGLHNKNVPCIFITHQLQILTGKKLLNRWLQKINYAFIEKFTECWIPDIEKDGGVAGSLSHPLQFPKIPVSYIGLLTRFSKIPAQKKYDILLLLSGPEPQRSILETMLMQQVKNTMLQILIVRGLPGEKINIESPSDSVQILSHLPAKELNQVIQDSEIVVARAGYSTIMDLLVLEKKAVLIPTPGQKEQEYLAEYLFEKKWFYCCAQENFKLNEALKLAIEPPVNLIKNDSALRGNIERLLGEIKVGDVPQ
jgi:uncharacterized protein (TIGR00661 family)